jgi:hypothetical protein
MCAATLKKDGDPLWSATVAEIPETPDEKLSREDAEKRGERALKKSQEELNINQHALMERLVALMERNNASGNPEPLDISEIIAREVARALTQPQEPAPAPEPEGDLLAAVNGDSLHRLHVRTLGKMCRERGVDDKGSKADLIARLTAEN